MLRTWQTRLPLALGLDVDESWTCACLASTDMDRYGESDFFESRICTGPTLANFGWALCMADWPLARARLLENRT